MGSKQVCERRETVQSLADQLEAISTTADQLLQTTKPPITTIDTPELAGKAAPELQPAQLATEPAEQTQPAPHTTPAAQDEQEADQFHPPTTDLKLSDYYGVSQINDAVIFVTLYPRANNVQIAGDFNNWQPQKTSMQKIGQAGVWQTKLNLSPGRYRYRLVVDGQWQQDPYNENTELNPFGGFNSVVQVI
ncbi:MAG: glycogen-binding domain-containing protein [Planctomycetota bacterium]|jgi:hypothetical protein